MHLLLEIQKVRLRDAIVQLALAGHLVGEQIAHVLPELICRDRGVHRHEALLDRVTELGRGLIAILGPWSQRRGDEVVVRSELRGGLRRHRVLALGDLLRECAVVGIGAGLVQAHAGEQLVQHDAGRVEIGAVIDDASADQLLGRHVAELAKAHLGIGRGSADRTLRDAEVDDLGLAFERHEHVGRRDIAVNQVERRAVLAGATVRICQAVRDLAADEQCEVDRQARLAMGEERQRAAKVTALDVLEREEVLLADAPDLEHLGDVDVLQLDRDLRFVDESRDELRIGGEVREHLLDHRELLEPGEAVLGEKDFAHAAARQALHEEVATEHLRKGRILPGGWPGMPALIGSRLQGHQS